MCKAFLIRHVCDHARLTRHERCPKKERMGECNGVKRIEVKSTKLCLTCINRSPKEDRPQKPPHHQPTATVETTEPRPKVQMKPTPKPSVFPPKAKKPDSSNVRTTNEHIQKQLNGPSGTGIGKKTFDWMKSAPIPETTLEPAKITGRETTDKVDQTAKKERAKEAKERLKSKKKPTVGTSTQMPAQAPALKRSLLEEELPKPPTKKRKPNASINTADLSLREPTSKQNPPTRVKTTKPRKKPPPSALDLHRPNTISSGKALTPKTRTIASLRALNAALEHKLRSFGFSPTLLQPGLFSRPKDRSVDPRRPVSPRRSPKLQQEADRRTEEFLNQFLVPFSPEAEAWSLTSPQCIVAPARHASSVVDGGLMSSPRGPRRSPRTLERGLGAVVGQPGDVDADADVDAASPNQEEIDDFERAMMQASPGTPPAKNVVLIGAEASGFLHGYCVTNGESEEESEEE